MRGAGEPRWRQPLGRTSLPGRRASSFSASPPANPAGVQKRMPSSRSHIKLLCAAVPLAALLVMALAGPASAGRSKSSGGATFEPPPPPPEEATLLDGRVLAPASAPRRVKRVIEAANRLVEKPYVYGGGHPPFGRRLGRGYDCSGAVSYALYGGRFLR